ncbi:superfamily I DNA/RNA helicase [Planomicrobium koreense]|uniref:Superfamily I DNA/RNA helicase n=1 Tax=Planococcus koreensis TaxID=112331 RepID=A0A7W8CT39_9BACL|nr:UvrD-helicase domain-containing protein [Planococcus koreensis]MBB5179988.1 superfamily I DNA/RNA helicase [Planococcus koreensis]
MIDDPFYKSIEESLLPKNCEFSDEQRDVILYSNNANIVAGPGSGKTTVLIAKAAYLLKREQKRTKGICIITHTNVAVDEITKRLKDLGIENLSYPNFIGTIHEFFNHFFAKKAYKELFPDKQYHFIDDEIYIEKFCEEFEYNKPEWYSFPPPTSKMKESYLYITPGDKIILNGDIKLSYKESVLRTLLKLLNKGLLRHNDSLSFTQWYLTKHKDNILKAFSERFSYLLLDEAQDTNHYQYNLLNTLVKSSSIVFQKFGDPYQALYNIHDDNGDAWEPSKESEIELKEISKSSRFGEPIAKILRTTCIRKYESLKSNPLIESASPQLIVFDDPLTIEDHFINIIEEFALTKESFRNSENKIAIVGAEHQAIKKYIPKYIKAKQEKTLTTGIARLCYGKIIEGFLNSLYIVEELKIPEEIFSYSKNYLKKKIASELLNEKKNLALVVIEIWNNQGLLTELEELKLIEVYKALNSSFNIIADEGSDYKLVMRKLKVELKSVFLQSGIDSNKKGDEKTVYYGTVHSVKGETHKATLILDTDLIENPFGEDKGVFSSNYIIFNYLMGNYTNLNELDVIKRNATLKALKLAYVALSRPTHIAAVAINKENFIDLEKEIDMAEKAGWQVSII